MTEKGGSAVAARHSTVLVVDDEEPNRQLLSALLSAQSFRVLTARDGASALSAIEQGGIDLVLLDVMMPGMDGIEVCRRVRQELRQTELIIVFVTALSDRDSRMRAKAAGANDFLVKPVDSYELSFRTRQWLKLGRLNELADGVQRLSAGLQALASESAELAAAIEAAAQASEAGKGAPVAPSLREAAARLVRIGADARLVIEQATPREAATEP
jgi:X-X-X-Leu-X-X-Gly heptad repeat protein